jgi:transducin (beta)-like 1
MLQERQKIWSWLSEHQKRAIFEMTWQQHDDSINRIAIALQSHNVGLIDLTRIPAVKKTLRKIT